MMPYSLRSHIPSSNGSAVPLKTLEDLRQHLQWAIELEHTTLPPYLCALYSIKPGTNSEAVDVIASVFIEEMLHMTLAANVLNAVGGNRCSTNRTSSPVPDLSPAQRRRLSRIARAVLAGTRSRRS